MTTHKRRTWQRTAVIVCTTAALTLGAGAAIVRAASTGEPADCKGGVPTVDDNGLTHLGVDCTFTAPAVTVTVPVPGPTVTVPGPTITETTTVTVTAPPSVSTTTVTVTPSPTKPPTPSPTLTTVTPTVTPPPPPGWPNAGNTGTPPGWVPTSTRSTSLRITTPGAVVQDIRFVGKDASLIIAAANVTVRRLEFQGGQITLWNGGGCWPGLTVSDTSFLPQAGDARGGAADGAIVPGAYTATRVKILNRIEGLRSGGCGPITVVDTYMEINDGGNCVLHADGIQGYYGQGVIVRNTWIDNRKETCGTAPFFYPRNQGNTGPVDIDGLWLAGGTKSLRLGVGPATLRNVRILDGSWRNDPVDVYCPIVALWQVSIVNAANSVVRAQACSGDGT